jgi:hypothetical protein
MEHSRNFVYQYCSAVVPLIIGGIAELTGLKFAMVTLYITLSYCHSIGV